MDIIEPMTLGDLRKVMAEGEHFPDDTQVFVAISAGSTGDVALTRAWFSQQVAWNAYDWKPGDPTVWGLEMHAYDLEPEMEERLPWLEGGVCATKGCNKIISLATFRELGRWEPDYDYSNDKRVWRHQNTGYAACFLPAGEGQMAFAHPKEED